MKNIVHKLLLEFADTSSEDKLSKLEIAVLRSMNKKGFTPKTRRSEILSFLSDDVGLDHDETMSMYYLFLRNYTPSGEYSNLDSVIRDLSKGKKIKTTNITARDLVKAKIPFKGSNTSGEWIGNVYVVSSYNWYPIFVFKNNQWYENQNRYSRSTGKQMGQLRPTGNTIPVSKNELNDLIYK